MRFFALTERVNEFRFFFASGLTLRQPLSLKVLMSLMSVIDVTMTCNARHR